MVGRPICRRSTAAQVRHTLKKNYRCIEVRDIVETLNWILLACPAVSLQPPSSVPLPCAPSHLLYLAAMHGLIVDPCQFSLSAQLHPHPFGSVGGTCLAAAVLVYLPYLVYSWLYRILL